MSDHKRLLLAESEINRTEFGREWEALSEGLHGVGHDLRSVGSLASTGAAIYASGAALSRVLFRHKRQNGRGSSSWVKSLINGARTGISIWLALRQRAR